MENPRSENSKLCTKNQNSVLKIRNSVLRKWKMSAVSWNVGFFHDFQTNSVQFCAAMLKSKFRAKFHELGITESWMDGLLPQSQRCLNILVTVVPLFSKPFVLRPPLL